MSDFVNQTHALLEKVHNQCVDQIDSLRFDPTANNQLMTVSLYCSLIEYAGTLLTLSKGQRRTGFSSVFRSFLEGYVDFTNLLKSEDFYYRKEAEYHSQWLKVLAECKATNPYLMSIAESPDLAAVATHHKKELEALEDKGHKPIQVIESFKMADMIEEYQSLYRFECAEAHNDFRALSKRNVKIDQAGKASVELYLVPSPDYYLARLDTTLALLLSATDAMHDKILSKAKDKFATLWEELHTLRKAQEKSDPAEKRVAGE